MDIFTSMKLQSLIITGASFVSALLFTYPAFADFGAADMKDAAGFEVNNFDARCGKKKKKCEITIDSNTNRIVIDKTNFVRKDQIKDARYSRQERRCVLGNNNCLMPVQRNKFTIDISYRKINGSMGTARVIFRELNAGGRFFDSLAAFLGVTQDAVNKMGSTGLVVNEDWRDQDKDVSETERQDTPRKSLYSPKIKKEL